jgi:homoserine O-acetyltransferase/O-succinyltransferase
MSSSITGCFELGDFALQSNTILENAFIGFRTYGSLNEARDNVIVFPTWYTGTNDQVEPYVGVGKALDPEKYFIVVPDMFTNGSSSSPSNTPEPHHALEFPLVTAFDNVSAQRRLLEEHFAITGVDLMVGFSMSGQQAYHWAALHSDFIKRACSICGSAKTSSHNWAMLHAYKTTMETTLEWRDKNCQDWDPKVLSVMASIGATMAMSQDWYREGLHLTDEVKGVTDVIENIKNLFQPWVPANLYAQTLTWMSADVSKNPNFNGDLESALKAIDIPFLMLPCETDMYFRVEDNEAELPFISLGQLNMIRSKSGHMAGLPGFSPEDDAFIDRQLIDFLQVPC